MVDGPSRQPRSEHEKTPKLPGWKHAVSGSVAGLASRLVIAPFDVIKARFIRFQLQSTKDSIKNLVSWKHAEGKKYTSLWQSARLIVQEEGITGLWKGNLSAAYLYLTFGGIQFYVFDALDGKLAQSEKLSSVHTFIAGAASGTIATAVTYPFDLLRTRFAVQGTTKIYRSLPQAFVDIMAREGVSGFYRGLLPSVVAIIPQMGMMFESRRFFLKHYDRLEFQTVPVLSTALAASKEFICGGAAGIATKTTFMPLDVVRKRLQVQGPVRLEIVVSGVPKYTGLVSATVQICKYEGFHALYKGLLPSLLKAGPSSAVTFFVVDVMKSLLAERRD
ncbi:mitochondrial thiamine pyrophosphate transporter [Kappamyces sp. JEL0680]|nr:mitochondrial thiamine pyrophosphate transporter [Kappamyces sp. JEL0680]